MGALLHGPGMISFLCTHCGKQLRLPSGRAATGRCPGCKRFVEVPLSPDGASSSPAARSDLEAAAGIDEAELSVLGPPTQTGDLGRLGRYRVLRVLGAGSMGIVFEAEDPALKRRVALKVMKKEQARKPENRVRFLLEARSAAAIEHDHIVTIYEVGEDQGVPFLAMKLLVGESLEDRINREGPLPAEEVVRIGQEIAGGLAAAHEQGLIHRDIKPANIWLEEPKGRVKIVDFGLARACDDEAAAEKERNYLIGTPLYMSPEQARGQEATTRSDLYALGAVLYRIGTGELPFSGKSAKEVLMKVQREEPEPVRNVNPDVPPVLARIITDLLQKDPLDRYRTAEIVASQLEESKKKLHEFPPEEPDEVEVVEAEIEKPRRPKRRLLPRKKEKDAPSLESRVIWWSIFAGVCVFLLLGFLVVRNTFFKKKDDSSAPRPAVVLTYEA